MLNHIDLNLTFVQLTNTGYNPSNCENKIVAILLNYLVLFLSEVAGSLFMKSWCVYFIVYLLSEKKHKE